MLFIFSLSPAGPLFISLWNILIIFLVVNSLLLILIMLSMYYYIFITQCFYVQVQGSIIRTIIGYNTHNPELTMWEKEKGMSPNPSSTLSSFSSPHGDHTTFSCLEGPQLFFIINLSDPLASLWLLSNGVCRTGFTPAPRGKSLLSL